MFTKRKRVVRRRGNKTHGWGSMKKRRGAGNRGGRGNAGSGKRGDAKKPHYWKDGTNKPGFATKFKTPKALNIAYLQNHCNGLVEKKLMAITNGVYEIDLKVLGADKLVSKGTVSKKFKITVTNASTAAIEKIKAAGGEVITKSGE